MKKSLLVFALLGISIAGTYFFLQSLSCRRAACVSISRITPLNPSDVFEDTQQTFRGIFKNKTMRVRVESHGNIEKTDADDLTYTKLMIIQGLFETARSPYPGAISDKVVCDEKYKPVPKTFASTGAGTITYYSGYLNNRLQYGTCIDEEITAKGFTGIFYCDTQRIWYQFEIIVPIQNVQPDDFYADLFKTAICQRPSLNTSSFFP